MRILFYDIESFPLKALAWGGFKQYIMPQHIIEPTRVGCWAAKEYGKEKIHFASEVNGHEQMVRKLHKLLSDVDSICGYNSVNFDNKMMNAEYVQLGLSPLPPFKQLDLYKVIRKNFRLPSYKLEYVAKILGIGEKIKHAGFDLWVRCMTGERKAWAEMKEYNIRDVELLEALYIKLLPWISSHPSRSLESETRCCPTCGSEKLQRRGNYKTKTGSYDRLACTSCGSWSRNRISNVHPDNRKDILVSV